MFRRSVMSNWSRWQNEGLHDEELQNPTINPLDMENVVEEICSNLDVDSLMSVRQINNLWNVEGSKVLMAQSFVSIPPEVHNHNEPSESNHPLLQKILSMLKLDTKKREDIMEKFTKFLSYKSRPVFKLPNISIEDIRDVELWKKWGVFGKEVKALKFMIVENHPEVLEELLQLLPNLENLDYSDLHEFEDDTDYQMARRIMNMIVSSPCAVPSNSRGKSQRPLVISQVLLDPNDEDFVKDVEKFSNSQIKVKKVAFSISFHLAEIPNIDVRMTKVLNQVLSTSKDNIDHLYLYNCERFLFKTQIPRMENLTYLDLTFYPRRSHRWGNLPYDNKFPPDFRFSHHMPNLNSIDLFRDCTRQEVRGLDFWTKVFRTTGPAHSVSSIIFNDGFCGQSLDKVLETFPNIAEYQALNVGNFKSMAKSLWKLGKNIESLSLDICIEKLVDKVADFDSIFTGFSAKAVGKIQRDSLSGEAFKLIKGQDQLRDKPSVLDLENLKKLKLFFRHWQGANALPRNFLAATAGSAFQLKPDLKIEIFLDEPSLKDENAFKEADKFPNVTISTNGGSRTSRIARRHSRRRLFRKRYFNFSVGALLVLLVLVVAATYYFVG